MSLFNAYVDGFNLEKGMLDGRPELRWLNVRKLCGSLLPQNQLGTCFYFTAAKKERFQGDREPLFHEVYLRAIASTGVTVVRGYFRNHIRALPLAVREKRLVELIDPPLAPIILWERMMRQAFVRAEPQRPRAMVLHTQEKRSDVSLASFLLRDGLSGNCQGALLLTNDGDFFHPLQILKSRGFEVLLAPTARRGRSVHLASVASGVLQISDSTLEEAQFSPQVHIGRGKVLSRPEGWN